MANMREPYQRILAWNIRDFFVNSNPLMKVAFRLFLFSLNLAFEKNSSRLFYLVPNFSSAYMYFLRQGRASQTLSGTEAVNSCLQFCDWAWPLMGATSKLDFVQNTCPFKVCA